MRPKRVKDRELLDKLFAVIRAKGYDGASIGELAEKTGLKKASLYHRYPGGKTDIVKAVLEDFDNWSQKHIIGVMESPTLEAEQKLDTVLENLNKLYKKGQNNCIYRSLSLDNGLEHFHDEIHSGIQSWIWAFAEFGESIGLTRRVAEEKAVKSISLIQGSLMVGKIMRNKTIFQDALSSVREMYYY